MVQDVPFHVSASVAQLWGLGRYWPVAVQALAEVQNTPSRELSVAPAGLGVACVVQTVPFHAAASVPVAELPTAVQALGEVQDMPYKPTPDELGVFWMVQDAPFHRSASVNWWPELFV